MDHVPLFGGTGKGGGALLGPAHPTHTLNPEVDFGGGVFWGWGGSSVRGPVDHVLLFGGRDQGGGALLGPAHPTPQPGSEFLGEGSGVGGGTTCL